MWSLYDAELPLGYMVYTNARQDTHKLRTECKILRNFVDASSTEKQHIYKETILLPLLQIRFLNIIEYFLHLQELPLQHFLDFLWNCTHTT